VGGWMNEHIDERKIWFKGLLRAIQKRTTVFYFHLKNLQWLFFAFDIISEQSQI
jgi:hypothetical protein